MATLAFAKKKPSHMIFDLREDFLKPFYPHLVHKA